MAKIMRVYLCGQDWTESHEEMYMDLPATPWELVDALEKLNLVCEGDLYIQAEEYYDFDYIQGFIPESTSLSRLNELCAVLDGMDEQDRIGFRGLLKSSAFFDRFNLGFDRLMDLALARDCYHIAADVSSDEPLGRFLCQNGFVEGADELPEKMFKLLDFQKIGKDFRMAEHGAFADGCYVAPDGDIPHREIPYGISPPEYIVMLDVVNKEDASKRWPLALPSVPAEMDSVLKRAGADSWSEVNCLCVDCQVPQLMEAITQVNNVAIANRFAEMLDRLPVEEVSKLKAILEVTNCEDLTSASLIAQDLDSYRLTENIRNQEDMGRCRLTYLLPDEDRDLILKHINLYAYGKEIMEQTPEAAMSPYGHVERTDGQPILSQTQQQACPQMTMQ